MSWDEPATGRQKRAIAKLCTAQGIKHEVEQEEMTRGEARAMTYDLMRRRGGKQRWK